MRILKSIPGFALGIEVEILFAFVDMSGAHEPQRQKDCNEKPARTPNFIKLRRLLGCVSLSLPPGEMSLDREGIRLC